MTIDYSTLQQVHIGAAVMSILLFVLRGALVLLLQQPLRSRWVRVLPDLVDTVLLLSALWLAWQLGYDGMRGWLWAKVVGLLVYIALGTVALKRGSTHRVRLLAFIGAIITFAYIVSVAITKSPSGFLDHVLRIGGS